jgi:nucleolar MIF4G domain-containing protein 1
LRSGLPPQKRLKSQHTYDPGEVPEAPLDWPIRRQRPVQDDMSNSRQNPKSIIKQKKEDSFHAKNNPSISPPVKMSRSVRDKLAEDDEEIATLERKLGLKGKKGLPKSFRDDGLDALLGDILEHEDSDTQHVKKRKAEGDEWLKQKRQQARLSRHKDVDTDEDSDSESTADGPEEDEESKMVMDYPGDVSEEELSSEANEQDLDAEDDFEGFDSEGEGSKIDTPPPRIRENPYIAPSTGHRIASGKYTPPGLRKQSSDSEILSRLRRQIQGLVNRLTESNMITILSEIEGLYREHPRHDVTSTLVETLLTSVCEPTALPDTLIILPAGFIAAIYKIIGTDFGAQVIQRIVERFDEHYQRATDISLQSTSDTTKETSNLIMLLSEMFNFQVVGSNLMYDYIRILLEKLSELNAELLLKIIRTSGPQLRQDDPSALKDIVTCLRPGIAAVGEENISVRTKFMIETINDLKNNRMKAGSVASAVTSEHIVRMKKLLGTLNTRNIKGSEPMRIGLKDIQDSDKKGKWWLVGASWKGPGDQGEDDSTLPIHSPSDRPSLKDPGTADLSQLAREQRMNTEVRRAIFVAIMSATDYQDACMRIMKLQLKKKQEFEIPKVLIHCAGAEKSYNPYYTLIAKRLCGDMKLKKSFQFGLWEIFKKMGESTDIDEAEEDYNDEDLLDTRQIVNLAKMFGSLIVEGGLGLGALKNLNLSYLQPKTKTFVEVLFITILLQSQKQIEAKRDEQMVINIFLKLKDTPQLVPAVQYFLKRVVSKTDIAGGEEQMATVKWACKVAERVLQDLIAINASDE